MGEIIEVRGVIALEFKTRACVGEQSKDKFDILERIAEDEIARIFERLALPIMLEILEAAEHREQAKIHRTHIERGDFRLELLRRLHALPDGHEGRAAGRQID